MSSNYTTIFLEKAVSTNREVKEAVRRIKETAGYAVVEFKDFDDVRRNESPYVNDYLLFVISDFGSDLFVEITGVFKKRIPKITVVGVPYFLHMSEDRENSGLRFNIGRHIFSTQLNGKTVVVGGQPRSTHQRAIILSKYMGAQVKDQVSHKVDYLFTTNLRSKKYLEAAKYDVPILKRQLVFDIWDKRHDPGMTEAILSREYLDQYKHPSFADYKMRFHGFSDKEGSTLQDELINQGGVVVPMSDPELDYIVIPNDMPKPTAMNSDGLEKMVMVEWFWSCLQVGYRLASEHYRPPWYEKMCETLLENTEFPDDSIASTIASPSRMARTGEGRYELLRDLALKFGITDAEIEGYDEPVQTKSARRSLVATVKDGFVKKTEDKEKTAVEKARQGRKFVAQEIAQVETNYVKILVNVLDEYKRKLEEAKLIPEAECRQIFGNLGELCSIHSSLNDEVENEIRDWSDESQLGKIIDSYGARLLKEYPPYINYLIQALELVKSLQERNTKFRAFLKSVQARSHYRSDLTDMLSRPAQQLPRYLLLLKELKVKTENMNKDHPDIVQLENALKTIQKVTAEVDNERGKAENQVALFDLLSREIQDCPPMLISAQRRCVTRFNCTALDTSISIGTKTNDKLCVVLFNDIFMICRRKSKLARKPSRGMTPNRGLDKKYEQLVYRSHFSLNKVLTIIKVKETTEVQRCISIALQIKEQGVALFTYQAAKDEDRDKIIETFVDTIIKHRDGDKGMAEGLTSEADHKNLNINLKELRELGTASSKLKHGAMKVMNKVSSRLNLDNPSEPTQLTEYDRCDSEASLTSISSNLSMVHSSTGLPFQSTDTPSKYKSPLRLGVSTVRGFLSTKKKRPRHANTQQLDFSTCGTFQAPKSLPPRETKK